MSSEKQIEIKKACEYFDRDSEYEINFQKQDGVKKMITELGVQFIRILGASAADNSSAKDKYFGTNEIEDALDELGFPEIKKVVAKYLKEEAASKSKAKAGTKRKEPTEAKEEKKKNKKAKKASSDDDEE